MKDFKTGLVSVSFRHHTPEEILKAMKKAGLNKIEWGSDVHAPCCDEKRLSEIVALQQKYGVECCSYGTYFRIGVNPTEEIHKYIAAAKMLGTGLLRLWCGNKGSAEYTAEQSEALFKECKLLAKIAEENGVLLCMECHTGTYTDSLQAALALMNAVDSPNFKMYWQPNQNKSTEDNLLYAEKIAPYTANIHAFNWDKSNKYPLAEADKLWIAYLANFDGSQTVLLEFMPDDNIGTLPREAGALKNILERVK